MAMDGLKAMKQNRWIVVGVDFSDGSMRALDYALKLATEVGANVACVHAYEDTASTPALDDPAPAIRKQLEDAIAQSGARSRNVRVDPVVRRGAPWDKLINVATEFGAELIVVGADGQRGASNEHFLGTVANRLATTSSRSVAVVPASHGLDPRVARQAEVERTPESR
jgi:nucleotide-binding universal stress UspA family protein